MRVFLFLIINAMLLYSCTENTSSSDTSRVDSLNSVDTLPKLMKEGLLDTIKIGTKTITNELAGANDRKRAILYFMVNRQDTSYFKCYVTESLKGKVGMELRFSPTLTYEKQKQELFMLLLLAASKTFNFDSLQTISIGRLVTTGDLAVSISNNYKPDRISVTEFLSNSKLADDFNEILKPYTLSVASVSAEKVFFTDKKILYASSIIETDSSKVPDKVLDALVWIRLKK